MDLNTRAGTLSWPIQQYIRKLLIRISGRQWKSILLILIIVEEMDFPATEIVNYFNIWGKLNDNGI